MTAPLLLAFASLALTALFSGIETGIYSLERVRLQLRAAEGHRPSQKLLRIVVAPGAAVCTALLAANIVEYLLAASTGRILRHVYGEALDEVRLELLNTLYVVPVVFVFGELLPKNLFLRHPVALVPLVWPLFRIAEIILAPVVRPLLGLLHAIERKTPGHQENLLRRESLAGVLTRDDEAERLSEAQRQMAERVMDLRSARVVEMMITWSRVVAVDEGAPREEVLHVSAASGKSRILVRRAGSPDFLGYVNVLDAAFAEPGTFRLEDNLNHLPEVPATARVTEALGILQRARRPLAIVRLAEGPPGIIATADIVNLLMAPLAARKGNGHELGTSGESGS